MSAQMLEGMLVCLNAFSRLRLSSHSGTAFLFISSTCWTPMQLILYFALWHYQAFLCLFHNQAASGIYYVLPLNFPHLSPVFSEVETCIRDIKQEWWLLPLSPSWETFQETFHLFFFFFAIFLEISTESSTDSYMVMTSMYSHFIIISQTH